MSINPTIYALIDTDEIAFKATAPSSVWQRGLTLYSTKKDALMDESNKSITIRKSLIQPFKDSVVAQIEAMIDKIIRRIEDQYSTDDVRVIACLSSTMSYRKQMYPDYKQQREGIEKPFYLQRAKDYIGNVHGGIGLEGLESDDIMSILNNEKGPENCVIVSQDKDLKTVVGTTYNTWHDVFITTSKEEADRNFWIQTIMGDVSDSIKAVYGMGAVKSTRFVEEHIGNRQEVYEKILQLYVGKGLDREHLNKNMFLLYMRRDPTTFVSADEFVEYFLCQS